MPTIVAQVSDAHGNSAKKEFHLSNTLVTTVAQAQTQWDALVADWEGVSDAGLSNPNVSFPLTMTPIAPKAAANLDEKAKIRLQMASGVGNENYPIPAPTKDEDGIFTYITGGVVDKANAEVVAYWDNFITGSFRIGVNALRAVSAVLSGYLEKK